MATSAELLGMAAGPSTHGDNPVMTGADWDGGEGCYFPPHINLTAAGACRGTPQKQGLIAQGGLMPFSFQREKSEKLGGWPGADRGTIKEIF